MLNLSFAMLPRKSAPSFIWIALILSVWVNQLLFQPRVQAWAQAQGDSPVTIEAPRAGDVLQGQVAISGTTDMPGFRSAEVAFAYQTDPTHTWFLIQQSSTPVKEGALVTWDTTTITDGEYQLRVRVFLQNGQVQEALVSGLRVRNYTLIETSTPDSGSSARRTPTPTNTPLPDFVAQPVTITPLPTNPAQVTGPALQASAWQGAAAVVGVFLAAGIYLGLRFLARR